MVRINFFNFLFYGSWTTFRLAGRRNVHSNCAKLRNTLTIMFKFQKKKLQKRVIVSTLCQSRGFDFFTNRKPSFTDDEVLKWFQHRDVVTHSSVQLVLRSCALFDTSLKLYSNCIRICSIKILVFKKLVLSPDEFLAINSSGDTYERQETRFFLICITYKVNTTRVLGNEKPKTRILPYQ